MPSSTLDPADMAAYTRLQGTLSHISHRYGGALQSPPLTEELLTVDSY